METLDEPKMTAELAATVEDGNKLEALWNKHMSAAISASPELATMPGMQKLARYETSTGCIHVDAPLLSRPRRCGVGLCCVWSWEIVCLFMTSAVSAFVFFEAS